MVRLVIAKGGEFKACGGCSDARGISSLPLIEGVKKSTMKEFAAWTVECDKVMTF